MKHLLLLFFVIQSVAFAQGNGAIPLKIRSTPANDLVHQGRVLSPIEAFELANSGFDLASLDPSEDQDIWRNRFLGSPSIETRTFPEQTVRFKDFVLSQTGKLRFLGRDSQGETWNFVTSKNVHAQLMRRNLLLKLGYVVPEILFVPRIRIEFDSPIAREIFVKELTEKTLGDSKRWIEKEDTTSVLIHDLICQRTESAIIDLSIGFIPSEIIRGKRVLNALHAVYALTDFSESANLFSWSTGYVFNNHLHLPYPFASEFFSTIDDIRWMANRIAVLNRSDWRQIVEQSHLPSPVAKLILEKLIARRNNLLSLVDSPLASLPYDPRVSEGDSLVEGELQEERFPGYAARFSYGDPDSPMNLRELINYSGVGVIGSMIDQLVTKFNSSPFLNNDRRLEYGIVERRNRNFLEQVIHYIKTNEYKPVPFGFFSLPMANGTVSANREVIAGNYLGTDNLFQLVDSIGVSGFAGFYIGMEGFESIFTSLSAGGSGRAGVYFNRIYSHVKPIQSMKAALRYPLSNILVPLAQIRVGSRIHPILNVSDGEMTEAEQKELMERLIPVFREKMLPGESFIITDTLGSQLALGAGVSLAPLIKAQIGISGNQFVISRVQILKVSEQEYQVYRDLGNIRSSMVSAGLNAVIPLLRLRSGYDRGKVKMDFYRLRFDSEKVDETERKKYRALRDVFVKGDLDWLKVLQDPIRFRYRIRQHQRQANLAVLQGAKYDSRFRLRVLHPAGEQKDLFRRYDAESLGINYELPGSAGFEALVKLLTKKDFPVNGYDGGGNAGFTFLGRAMTKTSTFESSGGYLDDEDYAPVVKVARIWNGWVINRRKAGKILDEIRDRYAHDFFPPDVLNETRKIFLYSFHVNFTFYHEAIRHVASLSNEEIDGIAATDSRKRVFLKRHKIGKLKKLLSRLRVTKDLAAISRVQNKVFDLIESVFTMHGIELLCGGNDRFFVYSRIEGFRSQDENGDQPVFSNSYGEYGHSMVSGPFDYLKRILGVSEAELGVNWLLRRIY
jgi:hypothetical protein